MALRCWGFLVGGLRGHSGGPPPRLGMRLVIQLLVDKYVDGLPLHRQRDRFLRLGIDLSVSTLCDQVKWCTDLLRPL